MKQLALIPLNQLSERGLVAVAIRLQQLLVGDGGRLGRGLAIAAALGGVGPFMRRMRVGGAQRFLLCLLVRLRIRGRDAHLHRSSKPAIVGQVNEKSDVIPPPRMVVVKLADHGALAFVQIVCHPKPPLLANYPF